MNRRIAVFVCAVVFLLLLCGGKWKSYFCEGQQSYYDIEKLQNKLLLEKNPQTSTYSEEFYWSPECDDIFFVKLIEEYGWTESLYEVTDYKNNCDIHLIDTAQEIHSVEFIHIKGFDNMIIKIIDENHMGNGSIYLYELFNKKMKLIFQEGFVDVNRGPWDYYGVFENGSLHFKVLDEEDGIAKLEISGRENIYHSLLSSTTEEQLYESYDHRSVYIYSSQEEKYILENSETKLCHKYEEGESYYKLDNK